MIYFFVNLLSNTYIFYVLFDVTLETPRCMVTMALSSVLGIVGKLYIKGVVHRKKAIPCSSQQKQKKFKYSRSGEVIFEAFCL